MAFRLHPGRGPAEDLRRVIGAELESAIAGARANRRPLADRVHAVRVAIKRTRAAIALVDSHAPRAWRQASRLLHTAARRLAASRDAEVLIATLDDLRTRRGADARLLTQVRRAVRAEVRSQLANSAVRSALARSLKELATCSRSVARTSVDDHGFEILAAGLERTYRQARRSFRAAVQDGSVDAFHRWRSHLKAHGYHCRLLESAWPDIMTHWGRQVQTVGRKLGAEHDLALLQDWLCRHAGGRTEERMRETLEFIALRRSHLREEAVDLGRRLCAEKPGALVRRLGTWWDAAARAAES